MQTVVLHNLTNIAVSFCGYSNSFKKETNIKRRCGNHTASSYTHFMDKTLLNALISYFKAEKIVVSRDELELQLFSHPYTPSLYAISETLTFLNIQNLAAQIGHEQLDQLPDNFIAFIKPEKQAPYFAHVRRDGEQIHFVGKNEVLKKEVFFEIWDGIILLAEQEESAQKSKKSEIPWIILLLIALTTLLLWPNLLAILFCIVGFTGLYISREIFNVTNDRSSYLGQKVCGTEQQSGCNKVLKSQDYYFKGFSLNDFLFSFLLSAIVFTLFNQGFTGVLIAIYALAFIGIITTIGIQAFVLKSWCRLCLLSSGIILVQIIIIAVYGLPHIDQVFDGGVLPMLKGIGIFGVLFFLVLLQIYGYRKLRIQNQKSSASEAKLLRFKRGPKTIRRAFMDEDEITVKDGVNHLILGNPEATNVVHLILSTSCGYCKNAFLMLYDFYKKHPDEHLYKIVFNHYQEGISDTNDIATTLINAYRTKGQSAFMELSYKWFKEQSQTAFLATEQINYTDEDYAVLNEQREWCQKNELFHTPVLIVNNRPAPSDYDASFLEDIVDAFDTEGKDEEEE